MYIEIYTKSLLHAFWKLLKVVKSCLSYKKCKKYSENALKAIQKSVDNAKAKLGIKPKVEVKPKKDTKQITC